MIFKVKARSSYRQNLWWYHKVIVKNNISGTFQFKSGACYSTIKNIATNKIIGLSDGLFHMDNSVRIGYRWNLEVGCLELMCLRHLNKKRVSEHLMYVKPKNTWEKIWFSISIDMDKYIIKIDGRRFEFDRVSEYRGIRYVLFPYVEPSIGIDTIIDIEL